MTDIKFEGVTAVAVANVYFDGKVVSHTIVAPDGEKKTLGLIFPGDFQFNTAAGEKMDITSGSCRVRLRGEENFQSYGAGESFFVPAESSFEISVAQGIAQYVCTFC